MASVKIAVLAPMPNASDSATVPRRPGFWRAGGAPGANRGAASPSPVRTGKSAADDVFVGRRPGDYLNVAERSRPTEELAVAVASRLRTRLARPSGAPCSGSFMRWMEEDDGLIVILAQAGHRSSALPIGERSIRDRGILRRTKRDPACAGVPRQYPSVPHLESASGRG
jgi:hypothetical protein